MAQRRPSEAAAQQAATAKEATGWTTDGWSGSTLGSPAPTPSGCWPATAAWSVAARRPRPWRAWPSGTSCPGRVAPATRLEVVVEPTGSAWLPIAVFFSARGHTVYRVSSAKAHDLRRVLSRHAKSNGIDADTLARLPLVDPAGLHRLQLPDGPGRRWTAVCGLVIGSQSRPPPTSAASRTWSINCCRQA